MNASIIAHMLVPRSLSSSCLACVNSNIYCCWGSKPCIHHAGNMRTQSAHSVHRKYTYSLCIFIQMCACGFQTSTHMYTTLFMAGSGNTYGITWIVISPECNHKTVLCLTLSTQKSYFDSHFQRKSRILFHTFNAEVVICFSLGVNMYVWVNSCIFA